MSVISTTVMAFSMSADAFAASISKGVSMAHKPRLRDAVQVGAVFGIIETITPIIGWVVGLAASSFITSVDHWIAFTILALIGCKMLVESVHKEAEVADAPQSTDNKWFMMIATAIGTSIDAMAVGVTLAFLDVNIWITALAIGFVTFLMATVGVMTGHYIGQKGGSIAEALGGAGLVFIGTAILFDHLGVI